MGKSKGEVRTRSFVDKKASREAKEDKKLALGVKRKQLKRKKDKGLGLAVESEAAAEHGGKADQELARSKKTVLMKRKKNKHTKVKNSHVGADVVMELPSDKKDDASPKLKKNKNKKKKIVEGSSPVKLHESPVDTNESGTPNLEKKKKKKVKEGKRSGGNNDVDEILHENQDDETQSADVDQLAAQSEDMDIRNPEKAKRGKKNKTKKVKKSEETNKIDRHASSKELDSHVEVGTADVDEIPSVDEDCSRGMKKWILEYKQKRPGLKVLQERIDEFITAYEEQQEQERKEREARAAEEGWTVVVHHKGRKKTTDTETGTAVGSVSLAAMQEKMAKKKPKEVELNFYRFQKREAHISELAMLQSKFEQDKKRIQQLRAQRKFKPY
ncbi:hypothetical protein ACP70R_027728 [Stipagrostis hirtigluma subsp. patula]